MAGNWFPTLRRPLLNIALTALIAASCASPPPGASNPEATLLQFTMLILISLGVIACRLIAKRHGVAKRGRWGIVGFLVPIVFFILGASLTRRSHYGPSDFTPGQLQTAFLFGLIGCAIAVGFTYLKTKPDLTTGVAPSAGRFCTSCGTPVKVDQKFCASCGTPQG